MFNLKIYSNRNQEINNVFVLDDVSDYFDGYDNDNSNNKNDEGDKRIFEENNRICADNFMK